MPSRSAGASCSPSSTPTEIARHTLADEFRRFDSHEARVLLLEGGPRVLAAFPEALSEKARRQLVKLGVEVRTGARVTGVDALGIDLTEDSGKSRIAARTVMWAAGVAASPLGRSLDAPLDRAGRVRVAPDLSLPGHREVFVIGDLAGMEVDGKAVPGVSPAAKQMGRCAAKNILARLAGRETRPFRYIDYGSLATIGRKSAVRPHLLSHRLSQPHRGDDRLGLGVFFVSALCTHCHRGVAQ
jgi:NADH dehydrogenase